NENWYWLVLIPWLAWWLWAANWPTIWAVLRQGAWLPLVLLMILAALVWSQMAPSDFIGLQFVIIHNFWWQLGAVSLLVALTLLCGWLQGVFQWTPAEISLEPSEEPAVEPAHGHH